MKLVTTHRNTLAALLVVPALAAGGLLATSLVDLSPARAQQVNQLTRGPQNIEPRPGQDDDDEIFSPIRRLPPCRPGTFTAAPRNCRPWTPPTHTASSKEDCECHVSYKTVNGQRVAVKDCYVLLPTDEVYYCPKPSVIR